MPHAAFAATAPADSAALLPLSATATKPRGNPNLHRAPRCGGRTRTACLCCSRAIHDKLRCAAGQARGHAPHGGHSPGPRTPESPPRRKPGPHPGARRPHHPWQLRRQHASREPFPPYLPPHQPGRLAPARYRAHLLPAPSANSPPQGQPRPSPTARFKPSRI